MADTVDAGEYCRFTKNSRLLTGDYIGLEERVPQDHPLRAIRSLVDEVLDQMSGRFEQLYSKMGRPSIPPSNTALSDLYEVSS